MKTKALVSLNFEFQASFIENSQNSFSRSTNVKTNSSIIIFNTSLNFEAFKNEGCKPN